MQTVVRQTWTGCILGLRLQAHSSRASVLHCPSSRRQLCFQPRLLHHMEFARPAKRQCIGLVVADTRADSTATLSAESPEQEQQLQQTIVAVKSTTPELQARKSKVLPVPQLVAPGSWSYKLDIWDCAALLVDKPQTWTSFDVCGKLKGVLKVKKASLLCKTLYSSQLPATHSPALCTLSTSQSVPTLNCSWSNQLHHCCTWQRLSQHLSVPRSAHTGSWMAGCVPVWSADVLHLIIMVLQIGHAGTLDPMATGLLIICTGKATKSIDSFQAMHKEYSGTMKLGEATNSYDADGDITDTLPWDHLTLKQLQQEAQTKFLGDLQQIPPMFSALRVKGKRLYESAREGIVVERAARPVQVSQFDITRDAEDPQKIHFYIACSKGTYIRSLAHDLGQAVGSAAHLVVLRREAIGKYNVKDAWTVDQLQATFGAPKHTTGTRRKAVVSHGNALKSDKMQQSSVDDIRKLARSKEDTPASSSIATA
ncbi:TPA: hypothetical protein ACH3X1_004161 [Trebouxia sp. C0004]